MISRICKHRRRISSRISILSCSVWNRCQSTTALLDAHGSMMLSTHMVDGNTVHLMLEGEMRKLSVRIRGYLVFFWLWNPGWPHVWLDCRPIPIIRTCKIGYRWCGKVWHTRPTKNKEW